MIRFIYTFLLMISMAFPQDAALPKKMGVKKIVRSSYANHMEKVRIKDIASFEGVRENQLVGYGLVVGLNGSGDTLASSPHTKESLTGMLERLGVNIREGSTPSGKNVAAVMVTATLLPFARHGSKIDVTVSAVGDAKDLRGGTLLVTPLLGADGEVYAVAQGAVTVSGVAASGANASQTKGVPTSGFISNGAIIEKEIKFELNSLASINLSLRNPDFTTSKRIATKLNEYFNENLADARDPSTVTIRIPKHLRNDVVSFMTEVEQLRIRPDQVAKVIIDDANGVIVMGNNVRISPVALTHGAVTIQVIETPQVSQPNVTVAGSEGGSSSSSSSAAAPGNSTASQYKDQADSLAGVFTAQLTALEEQRDTQIEILGKDKTMNSYEKDMRTHVLKEQFVKDKSALQERQKKQRDELATYQLKMTQKNILAAGAVGMGQTSDSLVGLDGVRTETVTDTDAAITEEKGKFAILDSGVTLEELVNALNSLGIVPKDMGAILHAIKASGSMQAEIISR